MGYVHPSTAVGITYSVRITDTPYITEELTGKKSEGTPSVTTEERTSTTTLGGLLSLLRTSFGVQNDNGVYDTSHLSAGYELAGEFADTAANRHEVVLASPLCIKDSMGGGYTAIRSIKTVSANTWKTIICQGGRRGTFTEDTRLPVFRAGDTPVADIQAGAALLCDDGGDLNLTVVLLTKQASGSADACAVTTESGTFDAGGFTLASA